jgi:phage/plasmid-like protein (TIGR03299 family)
MAHEVETMAYAHQVPWHGFGNRVSEEATPDEICTAAGLDWDVVPEEIYIKVRGADGKPRARRVPGRKALVRSSDNKIMGICGNDWHPTQNREVFAFLQDWFKSGGVSMETAISLRGGAIVVALASIKQHFTVNSNDHVKGYLCFLVQHRVGFKHRLLNTGVRVVCANTMRIAEREGTEHYSQDHLSAFNFLKAKECVEEAHENLAAAGKRAQTIANLKLGVADRLLFINKFFGSPELTIDELIVSPPKHVGEINAAIENGPGADPNTGWGVLNGVTFWADHVNGLTGQSRLFRSWVGDIAKKKAQVENALVEMAT